ncbi:MAG: 30S ribosomal protein S3ae [Thermoplasmata archaeon]
MAVEEKSRTATRKAKEKWMNKIWYKIYAPEAFDKKQIGETLSADPSKLVGRIVETTIQELAGDLSKVHIKLKFQVTEIKGTDAHTKFIGHDLTSDYVRRFARRRQSRTDVVCDVLTKDNIKVRVKAMAVTGKRIQSTQETVIRNKMHEMMFKSGNAQTFNDFVKIVLSGELGASMMKECKPIYPLQRVEIRKTELFPLTMEATTAEAVAEPTEPAEHKEPEHKEELHEETEHKEELHEETEHKETVHKEKKEKKVKTETKKPSAPPAPANLPANA